MKKHLLLALMCLMGITSVQKAYAAKEIYAVKNGTTMVLYYDDQKSSRANVVEGWTPENGTSDMSWDDRYFFTTVELDASMQAARPTSTINWFKFMEHITGIVHLDYLNTSVVTDMSFMFFDCLSLTSLDVTHFITANVTDMFCMFCRCTSLTSLDVIGFDVSNVTTMSSMFGDCSSLRTIYCNADWSASMVLKSSEDMFDECTSLIGGNGTAYDANHTDAAYARPDGGASAPGYFTRKIYTEENGWLYYDDGNAVTPFGPGSGTFYWAVMYPANTVNSTSLDQIGVFVSGYNTDPISISIRQGGNTPNEATEIATISFRPSQSRGMETVSLSPAVTFNNSKNLWIVLSAPAGYPAVVCANTGDPNSRWYSMNGTTWGDLANTSSGGKKNDYSFMVRAHFGDLHEGIEDITLSNSPSKGEKILRDGQLFILVGDKTYDARGVEIKK